MKSHLALPVLACLCLAGTAGKHPGAEALTPAVKAAVGKGIDWLRQNRRTDGSWRGAGNYGGYPVAMTSMAGLALICSGSTSTRGPRWREVREAIEFVLKNADAGTGLIASADEGQRPMFAHGFATLFLAQVYGMEGDVQQQQRLQGVLGRAVHLIERAQSAAGGWFYTADAANDEGSVTVTQLQALRACNNVGITVSKATIDRAVGYLTRSANPDGGIRYRAGQGGPSLPAITAAAPAVLYNAGRYDDPMAERAIAFVLRDPAVTRFGGFHYYGNLYFAQAMYQRGGAAWTDYYRQISDWLLAHQLPDGAWDGDGSGAVFATSTALIILQLPSAQAPIYQR